MMRRPIAANAAAHPVALAAPRVLPPLVLPLVLVGMLGAAPMHASAADPADPGAGRAPARVRAAADDPSVLREWQLPELRGISRAELEQLLLPWLGRSFGQTEREALRKTVAAAMEARGLALGGVAVRPLPGRPGAWLLQVVEPTLRRIEFAPGSGSTPLSDAQVLAVFEAQGVVPGGLLDLRALDQALFRLNDLPGISASGTLSASGDEGAYDLLVERSLRRRYEGSVDADNHGSRYNGRYRVGALLRINEPLDRGDNLDLRLLSSTNKGLVTARVGYEMPLAWRTDRGMTDTGWRVSAGLAHMSYELGDTYADLHAHGHAEVVDLGFTRPLQRSRGFNLVGRLGLTHKRLADRFDVLTTLDVDKSSSDLNAQASFESRDEAVGGGYLGGSLAWTLGRLHIATARQAAIDAGLGERATQGTYQKLSGQLARLQGLPALGSGWSLFGGVSGQWATHNLDGSEKFALGGPAGVRGYAPGEASADAGLLASAELRKAFGAAWSVYALYDWGHARVQTRPDPAAEGNTRTLRGVGLGMAYADPETVVLRAVLAWRGHDASTLEPGAARARLNLQLSKGF